MKTTIKCKFNFWGIYSQIIMIRGRSCVENVWSGWMDVPVKFYLWRKCGDQNKQKKKTLSLEFKKWEREPG